MAEMQLTRGQKIRKIIKRVILFAILLFILFILGRIAYASLKANYTETYNGYQVTSGNISESLSYSGSFKLIDSKFYTADAASEVRTIYAPVGSKVKKGDKLMRLANGQTVKADFDGTVNSIPFAVGDEVEAGAEIIQIADFTHMQVSFRVNEYDIGKVYPGKKCTVTVKALSKKFEAQVESVNYVASGSSNIANYTATVNVTLDGTVYPGMQTTVAIDDTLAKNTVILKRDALQFDKNNSAFVYMLDENQKLQQVYVELGEMNDDYVEILSPLSAGQTVFAKQEKTASGTMMSLMSNLFNNRSRGNGNNRNNRGNNNNSRNSSGGNRGNWGNRN